jgi:Icc-related predicted phosphoesterase
MKNMRLLFLGDIHGNFNLINQYLKAYDITDAHIIQVGDFGIGFKSVAKERRILEMCHNELLKRNVFVWAIRGNHDYKPLFDNDPFKFTNIKLVRDYSILNLEGKNILCVGGAVSVDRCKLYTKSQRAGDMTRYGIEKWWPNERFIFDKDRVLGMRNIDIVVTHTAPYYCPPDNTFGFGPFVEGIIKDTGDNELKTDLLYERQQMAELFHFLKLNDNNVTHHYYGHFHRNDVINMYGTKHRLLGVGELWEEK